MQSTQQTTRKGTVPGDIDTLAENTEPGGPRKHRGHETLHSFRVKPVDVGTDGFVDGGTALEWIDQAAHATAALWCGDRCVVASMGNFHLDRPIGVGELVHVRASLVHTGRSSMHILVSVCSSDHIEARAAQTSQCALIFVAVDGTGNPVEVPRWTPVTVLELQRQRQARLRLRMRKRIEGAMDGERYTAEGTAPRGEMRFCAATTDVDAEGKVRGGRVMRWIDEAAYVCGADWAGADVITAYLAGIRFYRPVLVGEVIEATARIIHTGPRSIHAGVDVTIADMAGGAPCLVARALVVVVSLDERGGARFVPQWEPHCDEDRRLDQHARHLIELRQFIEPSTTAIEVITNAEPARFHGSTIAM